MNKTEWSSFISKFNIFADPDGKEKHGQSEPLRFQMKALKADTSRSFIASGLIINGSLSSDADIMIDGQVFGDVFSKGSITVHGNVDGAICGRDIELVGATIVGDVKASGNLTVCESQVTGNIFAATAELDSRIKGNIAIQESLIIRSTADISGDIVSASISIEEKAVIDGKLTIKKPDRLPEVSAEKLSEPALEPSDEVSEGKE